MVSCNGFQIVFAEKGCLRILSAHVRTIAGCAVLLPCKAVSIPFSQMWGGLLVPFREPSAAPRPCLPRYITQPTAVYTTRTSINAHRPATNVLVFRTLLAQRTVRGFCAVRTALCSPPALAFQTSALVLQQLDCSVAGKTGSKVNPSGLHLIVVKREGQN